MKRVSRSRIDTFQSYGNQIAITGRKDHLFSTDMKMKRTFDGVLYRFPDQDERFDRYFPVEQNQIGHLVDEFDEDGDEKRIKIEVPGYPINKSIRRCDFNPLVSSNSYEASPSDYAILLPYVTETVIRKNNSFRIPSLVATDEMVLSPHGNAAWCDMNGQEVDSPEYNFAYHPSEQGRLFLTVTNRSIDNEEEAIYKQTIPQRSYFSDARQGCVQFMLESTNDLFNTTPAAQIGNNPGELPQVEERIGLEGLEMSLKYINGKQVFRTDLESYVLRVKASHFKQFSTTPTKIAALRRDYGFKLPYNIEIQFGEDGLAITKAVAFNGNDITEEVTVGDFFKMVLYDAQQSLNGMGTVKIATYDNETPPVLIPHGYTSTMHINSQNSSFVSVGQLSTQLLDAQGDPSGDPSAFADTNLNEIPGMNVRQIILYMPIRRYTMTTRHEDVADVLNDAQKQCPALNKVFDHFSEETKLYNDANPQFPLDLGGSLVSQFNIEQIHLRDEEEKNQPEFSVQARRTFMLVDRVQSVMTPEWVENNDQREIAYEASSKKKVVFVHFQSVLRRIGALEGVAQ